MDDASDTRMVDGMSVSPLSGSAHILSHCVVSRRWWRAIWECGTQSRTFARFFLRVPKDGLDPHGVQVAMDAVRIRWCLWDDLVMMYSLFGIS